MSGAARQPSVGVMGTGTLGTAVVERLVESGQVHVWNRTADRRPSGGGVKAHGSPADLAQSVDVVLSFVADEEAAEEVWFGVDGAAHGVHPGTVVLECGTHSPVFAERWAARMSGTAAAVYAPLTGSVGRARSGTLVFFLGGEERDRAVARDTLLDLRLAGSFVEFPEVRQAAAYKLVHNALAFVQLAALQEVVEVALAVGLDPRSTVDVLATYGWATGVAGSVRERRHPGGTEVTMPLEHVVKDLSLFGQLAGERAPLVRAAREAFMLTGQRFGPRADMTTGVEQ